MSIRRILAVLTGSERDQELLVRTLPFARSWKASIDGLFVRRNVASGADFLGTAFSTYGMEAVLESLDDAASAASVQAHQAFEKMADDAPSSAVGRFVEFVGLPTEAMAVEGRLSDLLVLDKPDNDQLAYNQILIIEAAARESGRPVLVLPTAGEAIAEFKTVVIAWDGSLEASRAVMESLAILQEADTVRIIHAGPEGEVSASTVAALAHYLALHGVEAATDTVSVEGQTVTEALVEAAEAAGADLLVMGGFGAKTWQRMLSRDETTGLLRATSQALLLAN
jgi:nucleotide-binding universal stress UspA family protein